MDGARWAKRGVSIASIVVVWFVAASIGPSTLPGPVAVASAFVGYLGEPVYWNAVVLSSLRVLGSFTLAAVIGIPLGLLIGWNVVFGDFTFPALELLRPVPPIAWIPFGILVLPSVAISLGVIGFEVSATVIFITFLGAFFPILLNAIEGVRGIDEEYSRAAHSLGAADWQTFRHVIYPGALPSVHTGMVVGMGLAWVNLVAAEMISGGGLGFMTWSAYTGGSYPVIFVGMITIGILGYVSSTIVRYIGASQLPWMEGSTV
ncbi:ABC transporter permease [Halobacteriales archaeon QH_8_64_26]|nr:MAG: ABC transporter permease [Halobacteriales archaeon QH_8_64_26]